MVKSQVLSEPLKKNIRYNIEKYFKEKGYYNVFVSAPNAVADTAIANHLILTYNVEKGEKLKINEIIITGNQKVTESFIERKMKKTREKQ